MIHEKGQRISVQQLSGALRDEILAAQPAPGSPFRSIQDICKSHGASPVTSQRALKLLERDGLIYSVKGCGSYIKQCPQEDGVKNIGLAFLLPPGSSDEVGVAFGQFGDTVARELRGLGKSVVRLSREDLQQPEIARRELAGLDALIMSFGCHDPQTAPVLREWGKPVVVIQHECPHSFSYHQVIPDLRSGYREAAAELLGGGAAEIALIAADNQTHDYRLRTMRELLADEWPQVAVRELVVPYCSGDLGRLAGRQAGGELLKAPRCGTVFVCSDFLAFGIVDILRENKLEPGREVRLASYDDLEGDGVLPFGAALLSSVGNPRQRVAQEAVRLLLDLSRRGVELLQTVRVPTRLVRRASTRAG